MKQLIKALRKLKEKKPCCGYHLGWNERGNEDIRIIKRMMNKPLDK